MSKHQDDLDLDLLLSLQDRVLETPPTSPSPHSPGYLSDDGSPRQRETADMSVFINAVQDCLEDETKANKKPENLNGPVYKKSNHTEVEKFSGLRIRNQLVTSSELRERFSDIRFVRLPVIKNLLIGDTISGCWATVGVLTEKGSPKTSSTGKSFCIWKIGCLDESNISLFLFGDAYKRNSQEHAGTVFALFNCAVRKDAMGNAFSLSAYSPSQILKIGTSVDYGVCKGKRKDGMPCTLVINIRQGIYCKYHKSKSSKEYSTMRTELKGGNLKTAFRPRDYLKSEGIYLVDPAIGKTNPTKPQPMKLLSVDALKKALSNADKVTTNKHSQGIRFLSEVTGKTDSRAVKRRQVTPNEQKKCLDKRKSSSGNERSPATRDRHIDAKRIKAEEQASGDKTTRGSGKMIELDFVSSDEDV
ncbi:uncharacterized protein LOC129286797 [Prosopis cineraria]|uniref:uncharacterized protein LOC129286797 n=1 Tax=Prosopis cineraria TaxID=364024 RepID=UPI00240F1C6A|nr:uncharacterized protein LOC129286797 [Prosopis cineraria]XP_054778825.1 uncharacterized protein LOC129286797 [Prosopis cineraria]